LVDIPTSVDWRDAGAVTPISDQGQCGSSPYWSAIVSIEGAWKIAGHPLTVLSTQQILDCSENEGNQGCNGGEMTSSFQYVIDAGGLETAADYPYANGTQNDCAFNPSKVLVKLKSFVAAQPTEQSVTAALAICPVASAMDASDTSFQFYTGGIYSSEKCTNQTDHGIGVVGYGENSDGKYYILKNTWTETWGMKGYMYLARGKGNMCGIESDVSYAVVQ